MPTYNIVFFLLLTAVLAGMAGLGWGLVRWFWGEHGGSPAAAADRQPAHSGHAGNFIHCRHCADTCAGKPENRAAWPLPHHGPPTSEFPKGAPTATWQDGYCPACGAAERIAAECERRARLEAASGDGRGLLIASDIARGDT